MGGDITEWSARRLLIAVTTNETFQYQSSSSLQIYIGGLKRK